jgi:hypothetical protein
MARVVCTSSLTVRSRDLYHSMFRCDLPRALAGSSVNATALASPSHYPNHLIYLMNGASTTYSLARFSFWRVSFTRIDCVLCSSAWERRGPCPDAAVAQMPVELVIPQTQLTRHRDRVAQINPRGKCRWRCRKAHTKIPFRLTTVTYSSSSSYSAPASSPSQPA